MRAQAELISTVIIVSVAVTVAIGFIYYVYPGLARYSARSQVASLAASVSSSLSVSQVLGNESSCVLELSYSGSRATRLYLGVFETNESLGIVGGEPLFSVYVFNDSYADAPVFSSSAAWSPAPNTTVDNRYVMLFYGGEYMALGGLVPGNSTLYDLGVFSHGTVRAVRVDLPVPGVYAATVFIRVSNSFYEVGRVACKTAG